MSFDLFFRQATGHPPYSYQRALASGSWPELLEAGTGSGKTAAVVLAWLWRRLHAPEQAPRRLVICQPMRTLVDQTETAVHTWLERLELAERVGVHTLMGGHVDIDWDDRPEREVVLIGTQDQLLSRALMRGYAMSRYRWPMHFAWLNDDCLWVMDEVQLMGVGLSTSVQLQGLRNALGTFRPTRSMWMSATLDSRLLQTVDAPTRLMPVRVDPAQEGGRLLELARAPKHLARAEVALEGSKADQVKRYVQGLAELVVGLHRSGQRTLVVLNRVGRAQSLHQELRRCGAPSRLLHSRFRPADRLPLQAEVLARGWEGILVSTQAVEAGVDISAAVLVTELAAWSSLVQRFGRCNRYAEQGQAQVVWIDLPDDEALPYEASELQHARQILATLDSAAVGDLPSGLAEGVRPADPVLRRKDLVELFDTTPDLTGLDLDVSRFVRAADDRDVQVAWRDEDEPPAQRLHREELCRVPIQALRRLLKKGKGWRWSWLEGRWEPIRGPVQPGMEVLLHTPTGGYSKELGWTGSPKDRPAPVSLASVSAPDADQSDAPSFTGAFVALDVHLGDTERAMAELLGMLGPDSLPQEELLRASRWHDVGKAHPAFQAMLLSALAPDHPFRVEALWAKSAGQAGSSRCERPHFRHELVSALARLEQDDGDDLVAYMVAAHHGKVRMSIRARPTEQQPAGGLCALGVHHGDSLPEVALGGGQVSAAVELDLASLVSLGGGEGRRSWRSRTEALLREHGPFRLAALEALVRVADWRASATPSEEEVP